MCSGIYLGAWRFLCIFSCQEGEWVLPFCSILFLKGLWNDTLLGSFFLSCCSFKPFILLVSISTSAILQTAIFLSSFLLPLKEECFLSNVFSAPEGITRSCDYLPPCNGSTHFFYVNSISVNSIRCYTVMFAPIYTICYLPYVYYLSAPLPKSKNMKLIWLPTCLFCSNCQKVTFTSGKLLKVG